MRHIDRPTTKKINKEKDEYLMRRHSAMISRFLKKLLQSKYVTEQVSNSLRPQQMKVDHQINEHIEEEMNITISRSMNK